MRRPKGMGSGEKEELSHIPAPTMQMSARQDD